MKDRREDCANILGSVVQYNVKVVSISKRTARISKKARAIVLFLDIFCGIQVVVDF
jgi:hypothetical protein